MTAEKQADKKTHRESLVKGSHEGDGMTAVVSSSKSATTRKMQRKERTTLVLVPNVNIDIFQDG